MKVNELKEMTKEELDQQLVDIKKEQFNLKLHRCPVSWKNRHA